MKQLEGKVALVTGGNSGLGQATAEAFARQGAKVVLAGRREALGREVEASIRASGGEATFIRCDLSSEEQIRALIEQTVQRYGRLDCAYNNAWKKMPKRAPLTELELDSYEEMFTLLRGTFLCMKYEILAMIAGGGGAIVNCSTVGTRAVMPRFGHYTAAKAGLEVLTRTAASEYAEKNIRVNAVSPGPFDTPFDPEYKPRNVEAILSQVALRRMGQPAELADAVLFLCSEAASFITGANLVVDGGMLLAS